MRSLRLPIPTRGLLCLLVLGGGWFGVYGAEPGLAQEGAKEREGAVVDAVLAVECSDAVAKGTPVVIHEKLLAIQTTERDELFKEAERRGGPEGEAIRDYLARNAAGGTVNELGPISVPHYVLTTVESEAISDSAKKNPSDLPSEALGRQSQAWASFYKAHPNFTGWKISLSHPGFSADGSVAVINVSVLNGDIIAVGHRGLEVLRKKDGKWRVDITKSPPPIFY